LEWKVLQTKLQKHILYAINYFRKSWCL
jgi:hypothetical protein